MKLPYGLADYHTLIRDGFVYVDRTQHIREVEDLGRHLLFVRPRRFGKSLWLSTLANWYDLRTGDEHAELFGGRAADRGEGPSSAHSYFVLQWNFSGIGLRSGPGMAETAERLRNLADELNGYVNYTVRSFVSDYRDHLPEPVGIEDNALLSLGNLLTAVRRTPHPLCLLIDEYDNFANEIMMSDEGTYKGLVHADGPFKQLMKWVKMATEGQGLKRLFITGVTPVVLSDLTSGLNIAENVSMEPELNALAGFTEAEIAELMAQIVDERRAAGKSTEISVDNALAMLRTWYNGYRFAPEAESPVYNPTLTLYYLKYLQRKGTYPRQMLDSNLAADENKLEFISRMRTGKKLVVDLCRTGEPLEVDHIRDDFTLAQMLQQAAGDSTYLASFLYYFGMLTLSGESPYRRLLLSSPNLVVRKLYLDKILRLLLPEGEDPAHSRRLGWELAEKGELGPLLSFVEQRLYPSFGRRDYLHMNELTVKTVFMALLFDDLNYVMLSEPSVRTPSAQGGQRGYADLVLLLRPDARSSGLWDLVLEFKYVSLAELGKSARELDGLDAEALSALPPVAAAFADAREQLGRYHAGLRERYGELRLRSFAVVSLGFERLVGLEVPSLGTP